MRGWGAGKLILCGEHAVVYGHPAIALAVDRGTTVTLRERPGPTGPGVSDVDDPRLRAALLAVLPEDGLAVDITTTLPIGRGMGSSAALAVALVRAEAARRGVPLSFDEAFARAFAVERVFHGEPSGVDHGVSLRGGVVRYLRAGPSFTALPTPSWRLVVLDSGIAGDTGALVAGVRARRVEPAVEAALVRIGALVGEAERALGDPAALGEILDENHARLTEIGVSTPALDGLVGLARAAGAFGAKLAGAGGGGVVIALVEEAGAVLAAAAKARVPAFEVSPR